MIVKRFNIPIYNIRVMCCFGDLQVKEVEKWLNCSLTGHEESNAFAKCYQGRGILWIEDFINRDLVFHECHHLLTGILKYIGAPFSDDESYEELVAHLNQYLVERVLRAWEQAKPK